MQASEMTFGVEIETIAPQSIIERDGLRIGGYHNGIQVPYLPQGWKAERDGSIDTRGGGHACEIVSPILRGAEGLAQVAHVLRTLEAKGHKVNVSCGVHVHVGWDNNTRTQKDLAKLVVTVGYLEKALFAVTGTKKRERGHYCNGLRKYAMPCIAETNAKHDRYHVLNLNNLAYGTKPTVEFRAFSGSISEVKIVGWIQLCLGIVVKSLNSRRMPKFHPAPISKGNSCYRNGEGQTEVAHMIEYLAWKESWARCATNGRRFGLVDQTIPSDEVCKEFARLAKKYDAEA
jgi:hypothetical protein